MARIRTIHPDSLSDRRVVGLTSTACDLWFRLRCYADDRGVLEADIWQLAIRLYPGQEPPQDRLRFAADELHAAGLLQVYRAKGRTWWALTGWAEPGHPNYQRIDRPSPSQRPTPCAKGVIHEGPPNAQGTLRLVTE